MSASAAAVAQAQKNASAFIARVRGQCDRPLTSIQMRMAVAAVAKAAVDVPSAHKFGAMTYAWCLAEKSRAARLKAREPPWYNTRSRTVKRKAKASRTRARLQCAAMPPWLNTRSRAVKRKAFWRHFWQPFDNMCVAADFTTQDETDDELPDLEDVVEEPVDLLSLEDVLAVIMTNRVWHPSRAVCSFSNLFSN
jgi:hypothetical protein